jgi:hypothetical protein
MEWNNPNTLPSHHNTPITTITFNIDLMELAIGMKLLTSHSTTPTTINVNSTCTKGMICGLTLLHAILSGVSHDTRIKRKKLFTCEQAAFGENCAFR